MNVVFDSFEVCRLYFSPSSIIHKKVSSTVISFHFIETLKIAFLYVESSGILGVKVSE
jgi:hypothetical protein